MDDAVIRNAVSAFNGVMIRRTTSALAAASVIAGLAACATGDPRTPPPLRPAAPATPLSKSGAPAYAQLALVDPVRVIDRVTWGANASSDRHVREVGVRAFIEEQLGGKAGELPAAIQATIDGMTISRRPMPELVVEMEMQRQRAVAMTDDAAKQAAQRAYQQAMTGLARESATRTLLRAIYSPNQLTEQMTWFWTNHFNVFQRKANLRAMVADYEERAIRPQALGRFRELLRATLMHPAMLRYLDNAQNAAGRINENHARELLELHTLGVDGGYTQRDVQELARVLTGVGIRAGRFEFHPRLHDMGDKVVLGHRIAGRGLAEVDEVIDILARHPATARHVGRKLATFFVADDPPAALVERLASAFERSDGDIAQTLRALFDSPQFAQSLGGKFKDPMHYVVSAARLALDDRPPPDAAAAGMLLWLARLGQLPNDHQTPDGYPLVQAAWASPGQMTTRFEFARAVGSRGATAIGDAARLSDGSRAALAAAPSVRERNALLLSSPEFMYR